MHAESPHCIPSPDSLMTEPLELVAEMADIGDCNRFTLVADVSREATRKSLWRCLRR